MNRLYLKGRRIVVMCLSFILCQLSFSAVGAAAPSWVKKTAKSVVTVKTFGDDGALIGSSTGVFVSEAGDVVSSYTLFRGASRAVVIDAAGKEWPVDCILGANETYDVVKFRVGGLKKAQALAVNPAVQTVGAALWLLPYHEQKSVPQLQVAKSETFADGYGYYTLSAQHSSFSAQQVGTPLLDEAGQLVALLQQPGTDSDTLLYAVSALFADSLRTTGLSINDPVLKAINIRKALPADESQAQLTLYVAGSVLDSAAYAQLVDDYIAQFPQSQEGYLNRAQLAAAGQHYAEADRDLEQALKTASKPDEVHYLWSRLVYQKALYMPTADYEPWTLQRALQEAEQAYSLNPLPIYRQQQAYVLFADKQYAAAYERYEGLFPSALRSPELFYEASRCKVMAGDTVAQLALLDSCVALLSRPYLKEAAPYLLARAQARMDAGQHRQAVNDLNEYGELMKSQLSDGFYFLRYQAELGGRLFQQALNDINQAITMNPRSELYLAELASLQVRVGLYDDAVSTAQSLITLAPDHSDGYLFLGVALCLKGQKTEGLGHLQRARELGDPQADELISKYAQ